MMMPDIPRSSSGKRRDKDEKKIINSRNCKLARVTKLRMTEYAGRVCLCIPVLEVASGGYILSPPTNITHASTHAHTPSPPTTTKKKPK